MKETSNTQRGREAARAQGHLTYFPNVTCKRGHVADRLVSNGSCVECRRQGFTGKRRMKPANHTGARKQINVSDPQTINNLVTMQEFYDEVLKRKVSFSVLFARAMALMEEHRAGLQASKKDTSREVRLIDALTAYRH